MGFGSARVDVGGAARERVSHSGVRAVSRIEVSRPETDTSSREAFTRVCQRNHNKAIAEKKDDKDPHRDGKRIGTLRKRAETRAPTRLNNFDYSAVFSFARSGRKIV